MVIQHRNHVAADGRWTNLNPVDYCSASATDIDCDLSSLTIDGTNQIFIGYSTCINPDLNPDASFAFTGTVGTVGSVQNSQGLLTTSFLTGLGLTSSNIAGFDLSGGSSFKTSGTATASFTEEGSPAFDAKGFFGIEDYIRFDGVDDNLVSTDAHFNPGNSDYSICMWISFDEWDLALDRNIWADWESPNRTHLLRLDNDSLEYFISGDGSASSLNIDYDLKGRFVSGSTHHICTTYTTGGALVLYLDGQLAATGSGTAQFTNAGTVNFRVAAREATAIAFADMKGQDFLYVREVLTAAQVNEIYSRRFTDTPHLAGGHVLADDSFPFTSLTNRTAYWGMDTTTDLSGNGLSSWTIVGSPSIGSVSDIFGNANSATSMTVTNDALWQDNDFFDWTEKEFSYGGWVRKRVWSVHEGASRNVLMGVNDNTADKSLFSINVSDQLDWEVNFGGDSIGTALTLHETFLPGSWHHFAIVLKGRTGRFYVDGIEVGSDTSTVDLTTLTQGTFQINGRSRSAANSSSADYDEVFYSRRALSAVDIKKLASSKLSHNTALALSDQEWFVTVTREDAHSGLQLPMSGVVDTHDSNTAYYDFSAHPAGSTINLELKER
jgi:hypothetical protein